MNPHKFAPGFFIVVVGVIAAYFVITNSFIPEQKDGQAAAVQTPNKPLVENPLQLINNFDSVKDGEESDFFKKARIIKKLNLVPLISPKYPPKRCLVD